MGRGKKKNRQLLNDEETEVNAVPAASDLINGDDDTTLPYNDGTEVNLEEFDVEPPPLEPTSSTRREEEEAIPIQREVEELQPLLGDAAAPKPEGSYYARFSKGLSGLSEGFKKYVSGPISNKLPEMPTFNEIKGKIKENLPSMPDSEKIKQTAVDVADYLSKKSGKAATYAGKKARKAATYVSDEASKAYKNARESVFGKDYRPTDKTSVSSAEKDLNSEWYMEKITEITAKAKTLLYSNIEIPENNSQALWQRTFTMLGVVQERFYNVIEKGINDGKLHPPADPEITANDFKNTMGEVGGVIRGGVRVGGVRQITAFNKTKDQQAGFETSLEAWKTQATIAKENADREKTSKDAALRDAEAAAKAAAADRTKTAAEVATAKELQTQAAGQAKTAAEDAAKAALELQQVVNIIAIQKAIFEAQNTLMIDRDKFLEERDRIKGDPATADKDHLVFSQITEMKSTTATDGTRLTAQQIAAQAVRDHSASLRGGVVLAGVVETKTVKKIPDDQCQVHVDPLDSFGPINRNCGAVTVIEKTGDRYKSSTFLDGMTFNFLREDNALLIAVRQIENFHKLTSPIIATDGRSDKIVKMMAIYCAHMGYEFRDERPVKNPVKTGEAIPQSDIDAVAKKLQKNPKYYLNNFSKDEAAGILKGKKGTEAIKKDVDKAVARRAP